MNTTDRYQLPRVLKAQQDEVRRRRLMRAYDLLRAEKTKGVE